MTHPPRPAVVYLSGRFEESLKKVPRQVAETALRKIEAMKTDWTHPWLDKKKLQGYENKWRFKINGQYRLIASKRDGDAFDLEFIGTKNQVLKLY